MKGRTKVGELREKPLEELKLLAEEARRNVFGLRMQKGLGQTKQAAGLRSGRKELARVLSILSERERQESAKPSR